MYKDKDKQREAVREATRRYRLRKQLLIDPQGITKVSPDVIPVTPKPVIPVATGDGVAMPMNRTRWVGDELTKARQVSDKGFND